MIIVDKGSKDHTVSVVKKYTNRFYITSASK
ncbi:MAG: hypothetical protein J7K82_02945 [Thermoproteales archaeon]|nr:hypothetical protein [Thermoproteales archaeon]